MNIQAYYWWAFLAHRQAGKMDRWLIRKSIAHFIFDNHIDSFVMWKVLGPFNWDLWLFRSRSYRDLYQFRLHFALAQLKLRRPTFRPFDPRLFRFSTFIGGARGSRIGISWRGNGWQIGYDNYHPAGQYPLVPRWVILRYYDSWDARPWKVR